MLEPTNKGKIEHRSKSGRFEVPGEARTKKAREIADTVRKTRGTFDRDKFDKFVDNNPLLSNLYLLSDSDD